MFRQESSAAPATLPDLEELSLNESASFFKPSPNNSMDSSFEYRKQLKLTPNLRRSFSPFPSSPSKETPEFSPIKGADSSLLNSSDSDVAGSGAKPKDPRSRMRRTMFLIPETPHFYSATPRRASPPQLLEQTLSVDAVLEDLGLAAKYSEAFAREEIDLAVFMTLNEADLIEIGVNDEEDKCRILAMVATLNSLRDE